MKPVKVVMPLPRCLDRWEKLTAKYKLQAPVYKNAICHEVTLPPGWYVLEDQKDHWVMYDENAKPVALIYLTKKVGFTTLYPTDKKEDARRKDENSL